jgi:hypothetical protein
MKIKEDNKTGIKEEHLSNSTPNNICPSVITQMVNVLSAELVLPIIKAVKYFL